MTQSADTRQPAPTVDVATVRPGDSVANSPSLKEGAQLFLEHGCLVLENVFEPHAISELHAEFVAGYGHYFRDLEAPAALVVGNKRRQITVAVEGGFNSPEFYANHRIFSLLNYLLGDDMVMGSMAAVFATPGAQAQRDHRDFPNIYDGFGDAVRPPYAVTVAVPLVPLDELTGSTRLWVGTHLGGGIDANHKSGPVVPMIALGDCYFIDYRLLHGGMPNRSNIVRPIMLNIYFRKWFRDNGHNYSSDVPLRITRAELSKMPQEYRRLFKWALPYTSGRSARGPDGGDPPDRARTR